MAKKKETKPLLDVNVDAIREETKREMDDINELNTLKEAQKDEASALADSNEAQYSNLGQIIGNIQSKIDAAHVEDEATKKRENAYRYITGLGDTLSSLANLVGVANKASNQKQTYNSHAVVQKAEEARKARQIKIDDLNKQADEMQARLREMKAAGSLNEAKMSAQHRKEEMQLKALQEKERLAEKKRLDEIFREDKKRKEDIAIQERRREEDKEFQKQQAEDTRKFNASENAKNRAHQKAMNDADNASMERRYGTSGSSSSSKEEEFYLGNGEFVSIPKDRMNDFNITGLYDMVPDDIKETAGKPKMDAYGNIVGYYPPTTQKEKLQAINRAAQSDPAIKDAIRNLAGKPAAPAETAPATTAQTAATNTHSNGLPKKSELSSELKNIDFAPMAEAESLIFRNSVAPEGLRVPDAEAARAIKEAENAVIREQLTNAKGVFAPGAANNSKKQDGRIKVDW